MHRFCTSLDNTNVAIDVPSLPVHGISRLGCRRQNSGPAWVKTAANGQNSPIFDRSLVADYGTDGALAWNFRQVRSRRKWQQPFRGAVRAYGSEHRVLLGQTVF